MELLHFFVCIIGLIVSVHGDGEVTFLVAPPSVQFRGHEEVDLSVIKDVCSASLGFTTYQGSEWSGMAIKNPFNFADGVVGITVPGVASLDLSEGHRFPLITDSQLDETWIALETQVLERFPYDENHTLVRINLEEGKERAEIELERGPLELKKVPGAVNLNENVEEDEIFLSQLSLLNAICAKVENEGVVIDGLPDVHWFVVSGLHLLVDLYGEESKTVVEAKRLLINSIVRLSQAFETAYSRRVLNLVLASDVSHTRRYRREVTDEEEQDLIAKLNLAEMYSEDYPVMFNIFLWFGIAFVMTILAISIATAEMDPGRDSIIYRMTSNRMKKDN